MSEFVWPSGKVAAAAFTFDVDAESAVLWDPAGDWQSVGARMSVMSHQAYGPLVGLPRIDAHHTLIGRVVVRKHQQCVPIVVQHRHLIIEFRPHRNEWRVRMRQVLHEQRVAILALTTVTDRQHGKAFIVGGTDNVEAL